MNALNEITNILKAMGANPQQVTRPNGVTVIKVNAPILEGGNNEKTENKKV